MKVDFQYAETHRADLIAAVDNGEQVEIARQDKPALRLVASLPAQESDGPIWRYPEIPRSEVFGYAKGNMYLADDWDSPEVNAEIADLFENSVLFPKTTEN